MGAEGLSYAAAGVDIAAYERALINKALAKTGGRRIEAANLLGMGRNTITRKIQELGIEDREKPVPLEPD